MAACTSKMPRIPWLADMAAAAPSGGASGRAPAFGQHAPRLRRNRKHGHHTLSISGILFETIPYRRCIKKEVVPIEENSLTAIAVLSTLAGEHFVRELIGGIRTYNE